MAESKERESIGKRFLTVFEKLALKSIATGNFGWFVVLVVAGGIIWKMQSEDLKEVLLKMITNQASEQRSHREVLPE